MSNMRILRIDKVVVNISVGEAGEKLSRAETVLKMLTRQTPIQVRAKSTIKDWGLRMGMPMATKVTLRGKNAEEFLKRAFWTKNNMISAYSFDDEGNFSLGISDYTDFENMKYDPEIGSFGMDISVLLRRKGARVERRRVKRQKVPKRHRVTRDEGIEFMKAKYNLEVVE